MTKNSKDPLDGLPPEVIDAILRRDLPMFTRAVAFPAVKPHVTVLWAPFLDLIGATLQKVAEGGLNRVMITVPPRHGKTISGSVALTAWYMGHNPGAEVMCVSYSSELAREFGEQARKVMLSQAYIRLFGPVLASARGSPLLLRTTSGGVRRATSIEGTATGLGADLLVFDDPQKSGESLSEAIRRSSNSAFENTFLSRQNDPKKVKIVVIQQRLHEDDFVGHVSGLSDDWTIINLPAIAEEDETWTYETFLGQHTWARKEGEALHPERFPEEALKKTRIEVGEAAWATQWQQRPAPAGGGIVQVKWFKRVPPDKMPELTEFERIIQSWDTANKTAEWNDFSVCTTWGILRDKLYLINVTRRRMIYPDLKRAVIDLSIAFNATVVLIEDRASGQQLLQDLVRDGFTKAVGVDPDRDKQMRMASQTAIIENGFVHVPEDVHWGPEYFYELQTFPNGRFADQVDSTSQFLGWYNNFKGPNANFFLYMQQDSKKTAKDVEEKLWTVRVAEDQRYSTFYLMDGSVVRPDAEGRIRTTRESAQALLKNIGFTRIDDDEAA